MSYDTEHVRNVGDTPETITGIPTFTELLTNPSLASLYMAIWDSPAVTAPELVEMANVSKKTVYEYLRKLERAGLITEVGDDTGPSAYEAAEFELSLTIRDVKVSITPALVKGVAHADEYPVIDRVLDDHGLVTFALAHDLVKAHADGEVTIRQLATLTGLSTGTAYDIVEALYTVHGLGAADSTPTTLTPDDLPADEDGLGEELPDGFED